MLYWCFNEVIRVLQEDYLGAKKVFLCCQKVVTRVLKVKIQEWLVTSQELQLKSGMSRETGYAYLCYD